MSNSIEELIDGMPKDNEGINKLSSPALSFSLIENMLNEIVKKNGYKDLKDFLQKSGWH